MHEERSSMLLNFRNGYSISPNLGPIHKSRAFPLNIIFFFPGQVTIPSKIPQQQRHLGGGQVTIVGGNQGENYAN